MLTKRCWTEIDLDCLAENYRICRRRSGGREIMAVIKADAYGHGDEETALRLWEEGVRMFAVSNLDEAARVRRVLRDAEILILGYTPAACAMDLERLDIVQTIVSEEHAADLAAQRRKIRVQFAIDTGMNRIGLDAESPEHCSRVIRQYLDSFRVEGIFTHLCVADSYRESDILFTNQQMKLFEDVAQRVSDLQLPRVHCLNSAGGLLCDCPYEDIGHIMRLGIIMYGLKPARDNTIPSGIRPALSWKSVVAMVKEVNPGESIGYGRTYTAVQKRLIATIPTGYADGYNRLLSDRGYVLINGMRAPITGRICMDQMMVDVTDIPDVKMGTEAVLIGTSGSETITADMLAEMIGTIGYEIICDISKRVDRVFLSKH